MRSAAARDATVTKPVPGGPGLVSVHGAAPFAVGVVLWRDETERLLATVVAKTTFQLAEGTSALVDPEPVREGDEPNDLAPFKASNEVVVLGRASGFPRSRRVAIGDVDKSIAARDSAPVFPMGGAAARSTGFGPTTRDRDARLRAEDREWLRDPAARPRPQGFDPRYFCGAPADQQTSDALRPDDRLVLEGLLPSIDRLVTHLAGVTPTLRTRGPARDTPLPAFIGDTLIIDADRSIATLVFRAILPVGDGLDLEVVTDAGRARVDDATTELDRNALNDVLAMGVLPFPPPSERDRDFPPNTDDGALPFRPSAPPPPPPAPAPPRSTVGQLQSLSRGPSSSDARSDEGPRTEEKDRFRKAFGFGGGAASPTKATPSIAPAIPESTPVEASPPSAARPAVEAVPSGAKAASDAALIAAIAASPKLSQAGNERVASTAKRRAIVDLIAFDDGVPARLRRSKVHAPLLVEAEPPRTAKKLDAPAGDQSAEQKARLEVLRVLSCGTPVGPDEIDAALDALLDDATELEIPLFLVAGDLRPTMDEIETLKVATEIVKGLAGVNKRVLAALAAANDALARENQLVSDTAALLYKRLEQSTVELSLPARHVSDLVDRTLLEARSYKRRTLLGSPRIRAELALGRVTLPIYLPDSATPHLPLLPTFPSIALVECRPREDASEVHPTALVTVALGRVLRARGGKLA